MKIFQVNYSTDEKAVNIGYVVCNGTENIKEILSKREGTHKDDIAISYCNEASVEQVYIKDMTIADFFRLIK